MFVWIATKYKNPKGGKREGLRFVCSKNVQEKNVGNNNCIGSNPAQMHKLAETSYIAYQISVKSLAFSNFQRPCFEISHSVVSPRLQQK